MKIAIVGSRGIPARHGGFETFAEQLALYMARRGWDVSVYCQEEGSGELYEDRWKGIRLIHIHVGRDSAFGSILFDLKSTIHAAGEKGVVLTLGYNTALFSALYRLKNIPNLINMDGLEWKRQKWSLPERAWLYLNERLGCLLGNHLIADHPEIEAHLRTRVDSAKITMIPYGANPVESGDVRRLSDFGLAPREYALVIARPEPENSILEIVSAYSRKPRGRKLVVLGNYDGNKNAYHAEVLKAAGRETLFPGAIYDQATVGALRYYTRLYIHGHQVGGTNPSLVEAMGAGSPVLARDNRFNRWVAGDAARYFSCANDIEQQLDSLLHNDEELLARSMNSLQRYRENFTWDWVLLQYENILHGLSQTAVGLERVENATL